MAIRYLQHVQLNVPAAVEPDARQFYGELLRLEEMPRPESLSSAGRKGIWYRVGDDQELHVFLNPDGRMVSSSAHPALIVDALDVLRARLAAAGCEVEEAIPIDGRERFFVRDPGGNRLEFLAFV